MSHHTNPVIYYHFGNIEQARSEIAHVLPESRVISRPELQEQPELRAAVQVIAGWPNISPAEWPQTRWIQIWTAGVSREICEAAATKRFVVTNTSGIHAEPIAEQALAMMLMFARRMHLVVCKRTWGARSAAMGATVLHGATLGVVGLGAIGRRLAELGAAFGMRRIAVRRHPGPEPGFDWVGGPAELGRLMEESDYVFNVLPLTDETRGLITADMFARMHPDAYYLNFGRGATQDTDALVSALRAGSIAGAGLDAHDPEPLPDDHPLWELENAVITPHYSGMFCDYDAAALEVFVDNLKRFRDGQPLRNRVNPELCY
jgi:phosphoglycerate dehydrogenase-like enzyme